MRLKAIAKIVHAKGAKGWQMLEVREYRGKRYLVIFRDVNDISAPVAISVQKCDGVFVRTHGMTSRLACASGVSRYSDVLNNGTVVRREQIINID